MEMLPYGWKQTEREAGGPISISRMTSTSFSPLQRLESTLSTSAWTPDFVSEDTSTILLNSLTGIFFPSCHSHPDPMDKTLPGFRFES